MIHHHPRFLTALTVIGASLLVSSSTLAQTPLGIEEAVQEAQTQMDDALRSAAAGEGDVRTSNAAFKSALAPQEAQASEGDDLPSEAYFFEDDEARVFWLSLIHI